MTSNPEKELLDKISEYMDSKKKEIDLIQHTATSEIEQIRATSDKEIKQIRSEADTETAALKTKLKSLLQTEDNNKFQKRTIASLTSEIATLQSTITALEKRLKLATEEVRSLKQAGHSKSILPSPAHREPVTELATEHKHEAVQTPVKVQETQDSVKVQETQDSVKVQETQDQEDVDEQTEEPEQDQDDGPQLVAVVLESGVYFWDPDTNDLYEFISDEEAGEIVSVLKTIKIKNEMYYLDPVDSHFYEILGGGDIGVCLGEIVDRKAQFRSRGQN
jgi:chromosome segregation ATPase